MALSWVIPTVAVLLFVEAVLSGSEIALISANRIRLRALAEGGNSGARKAMRLL